MKLNLGFFQIFQKRSYLIKAIGWSESEARDLEMSLNSDKRFVVITKDVQVMER